MGCSQFVTFQVTPAPAKDSTGWVLSPHGAWDSHIPECFPYVHFSTNDVMTVKAEK